MRRGGLYALPPNALILNPIAHGACVTREAWKQTHPGIYFLRNLASILGAPSHHPVRVRHCSARLSPETLQPDSARHWRGTVPEVLKASFQQTVRARTGRNQCEREAAQVEHPLCHSTNIARKSGTSRCRSVIPPGEDDVVRTFRRASWISVRERAELRSDGKGLTRSRQPFAAWITSQS